MKISGFSSLLALALWHFGCDGATVGAPKQQEGGLSTEVATYEEKMHVPDVPEESYVRITPRDLYAHYVIKLELSLIALVISDVRRKTKPSRTAGEN